MDQEEEQISIEDVVEVIQITDHNATIVVWKATMLGIVVMETGVDTITETDVDTTTTTETRTATEQSTHSQQTTTINDTIRKTEELVERAHRQVFNF